jgi:hypothetical protein
MWVSKWGWREKLSTFIGDDKHVNAILHSSVHNLSMIGVYRSRLRKHRKLNNDDNDRRSCVIYCVVKIYWQRSLNQNQTFARASVMNFFSFPSIAAAVERDSLEEKNEINFEFILHPYFFLVQFSFSFSVCLSSYIPCTSRLSNCFLIEICFTLLKK